VRPRALALIAVGAVGGGCSEQSRLHLIAGNLPEPRGFVVDPAGGFAVQEGHTVVLVSDSGEVQPLDPQAMGVTPVATANGLFYAASDGQTSWIAKRGGTVISPDADVGSDLYASGGYVYWTSRKGLITRVPDTTSAPTAGETVGSTPSYAVIGQAPDGTVFFGAQDGLYEALPPDDKVKVAPATDVRAGYVDGGTFWLIQPGSGDVPDGQIDTFDFASRTLTPVAAGEISPNSIAVTGGRAYWTCDFDCGGLRSVLPGQPAVDVAIADEAWDIEIANGTIYFTDSAAGSLESIPVPSW
jgi:hypothetical protein